MDLFKVLDRGVARSGSAAILKRPNAQQRRQSQAIAKTRKQWLQALMVDETAAWMSTYEERPDVLRGLCTVLTLAALAKENDDGHADSPEVRVIRGAVSAAEQAGKAGSVITPDTAQALSSAARMARDIVVLSSEGAIAQACVQLNYFVRQIGS